MDQLATNAILVGKAIVPPDAGQVWLQPKFVTREAAAGKPQPSLT